MTHYTGYMALQELLSGNLRFVKGETRSPDRDAFARKQLLKGQSPSAVIIGCSDSRVPLSTIFDQGLGFIFAIRTPGHIIDDVTLGSVEYALNQLGTQLVMVLGHSDCGAVSLAMSDGVADGYLGRVQKMVRDVIAWADGGEVDVVDASTQEEGIEFNVRGAVEQVRSAEPVISAMIRSNRVMLVGAIYDLETGLVRVLE